MIKTTEQTAGTEVSLAAIEAAAKRYALDWEALGDLVRDLNAAVHQIKVNFLPAIKKAVARAAEKKSDLHNLVEGAQHLFVKPRTVVFHGIKCGWEKGKGKITFDDPERVCALIHKHFPEMAEALVIIKETPNKKALAELNAADLKRLGIFIEDSDDRVVIRAVNSDVDKIVTALLSEAEAETN